MSEVSADHETSMESLQPSAAGDHAPAAHRKRKKGAHGRGSDLGWQSGFQGLRRRMLLNDPEYMDDQISELRKGKMRHRNRLNETSGDELFENRSFYTAYAMTIRHRSQRLRQSPPAIAVSSSDGFEDGATAASQANSPVRGADARKTLVFTPASVGSASEPRKAMAQSRSPSPMQHSEPAQGRKLILLAPASSSILSE